MNNSREKTGLFFSAAVLAAGVILRLTAQSLAWPNHPVSYAGSRAESSWARMEDAYSEVALVLMCIGGLLLVVTYASWLLRRTSAEISPRT